jgi:hypothetical protein
MLSVTVLTATVVCTGLVISGCGKRQGDRGAVYPVEGQVLLGKKPIAGAILALIPQGVSDAAPSRATAGADGRFRVSTFGKEDGAPQGEYAVTVVSYPIRPGDGGASTNVLPKKYASLKTTDLRVKVSDSATVLPAIVLQEDLRRRNTQGRSHGGTAYE